MLFCTMSFKNFINARYLKYKIKNNIKQFKLFVIKVLLTIDKSLNNVIL